MLLEVAKNHDLLQPEQDFGWTNDSNQAIKSHFFLCLRSFERTKKKKNVCMNNPFLGTEAYAFIFLKN